MSNHLPIPLSVNLSIRTELVGNAIVGWFETPVLHIGDETFVPMAALERLTAAPPEPREAAEQPMLLTQEAAAKRLGVSVNVLRRLIRNGDIGTTPITDGRRYVPVAELERYIADSTAVSVGANQS